MPARVLSVRADLEDARARPQAALGFARTAIRLAYTRPEPRDIAISHHNLATYLGEVAGDPAGQRAHRLAAALIYQLTGMTHNLTDTLRALAAGLHANPAPGAGRLPGGLEEVIEAAGQTEGVHLGELIAALQPDTQAAAAALTRILDTAADMPASQPPDLTAILREWEPAIAAITAAAGGGQEDDADLRQFLDELASTPDWAALAAVLRRILAGERSPALLGGLDPVDTAITTEILTRLTPPASPPPPQP